MTAESGGRILAIQNARNSLMVVKCHLLFSSLRPSHSLIIKVTFAATANLTIAFFAITSLGNVPDPFYAAKLWSLAGIMLVGMLFWISAMRSTCSVLSKKCLIGRLSSPRFFGKWYDPSDSSCSVRSKGSVLFRSFFTVLPSLNPRKYTRKVSKRTLNFATISFWAGIRGYYASVLIAAWMLSSVALLVSTLLLLLFLVFSDHTFQKKKWSSKTREKEVNG